MSNCDKRVCDEINSCCGTTCNKRIIIDERAELLERIKKLEGIIKCLGYLPETD